MSANGLVNMLRISTGIMIGQQQLRHARRDQVAEVAHQAVLRDARVLLGREGDEGQAHR